jgi:HEAT repeat protein
MGVAILALLLAVAGEAGADEVSEAIEEGLAALGLDRADTHLPIDPGLTDPFRLPLIDRLLADPLATHEEVRALAAWSADPRSAAGQVVTGASELFSSWRRPGVPARDDVDLSEVFALGQSLTDAGAPPTQVAFVTACLRACLIAAAGQVPLDPALLRDAADVHEEDEEEPDLDPFALRDRERASIVEADAFFAQAERLDVSRLIRAAAPLADLVDEILSDPPVDTANWVPLRWTSSLGPVVVGSLGDDRHPGGVALLIDPGGDDHYPYGAGGTGEGERTVSLTVDLAGDDTYVGRGTATLAAGLGGTGVLVDLAGDDVYRGESIALGAGVCGVGILVDAAGHDVYEGREVGQGAGFLGLGLLLDVAGSDVYRLSSYGQGYGGVAGVGILRDYAGGDRYLSMPLHTDVLRYEDHHISFLQGAAFGARPDRSGGVGLLVDDAGNDLYQSDIFGQGVAYWFALGALVDRAGHDTYAGYQYSQGAGVHLAVGLLLDEEGEDLYSARGVSQGCGHDLAYGLLADLSGNDTVVSHDLSQGAGSANGMGVFLDASGEEAYVVRRTDNSMGYGNPRRGTGSIGLFLDGRGSDAYARGGGNDAMWGGSSVGVGLDRPEEMSAAEVWPEDDKVAVPDSTFTDEELFVLASTGPPKYSLWRERAIELLGERGEAAAPTLLRYMNTRIPRERHGLKDVFVRMGEVSVPFLASVIDTGEVRSVREAAWSLGFVGAVDGLAPLASLYDQTDPSLRSAAAMAVARIARRDSAHAEAVPAQPLRTLLDDPDRNVRRAAAFALGSLGRTEIIPVLVEALDDPFFGVRLTARDALVRQGAEVIDAVEARATADGVGRIWSLGVLERIDHVDAARSLAALAEDATGWDPAHRLALARAMSAQLNAHEELRAPLIALAGDDDWRVAAVVREALK